MESRPRIADPDYNVSVCPTLLTNDATKVCKALHLLQRFAFQRDGGISDCVDLHDFALPPVGVKAQTY